MSKCKVAEIIVDVAIRRRETVSRHYGDILNHVIDAIG